MHPALHTWRDDIRARFVRLMAYVGALALLSILAAQIVQAPSPIPQAATPPAPRSAWNEIDKPFPAFAISIPEAADVPFAYAIKRHETGNGRKDILSLGDPNGEAPWLRVELYRPGTEIARFAAALNTIETDAAALAPASLQRQEMLDSKFGPLEILTFETGRGTPRKCLAFVRAYDDPMLQLSGWFCQGGALVERSTLACALDRLTLLSAGSEPKIGALFARIELNRAFCGQRDPLLASTPKYRVLWKAWEKRPASQRIR
jgi:hypothetical protein